MSRFAKLVNAKAAREQEPAEAPEGQKRPEETTPKNDSDVKPSTPVVTGVDTLAITPVVTPVKTPVITPVTTGATQSSSESAEGTRESARSSTQYLDASHTASEKSVYSVMYRETVSRGVKE